MVRIYFQTATQLFMSLFLFAIPSSFPDVRVGALSFALALSLFLSLSLALVFPDAAWIEEVGEDLGVPDVLVALVAFALPAWAFALVPACALAVALALVGTLVAALPILARPPAPAGDG